MRDSIQKRLAGCAVRLFLLTLLLSASLPLFANDGTAVPPASGSPVDLMWGTKIPMRDGVGLNATVYKPKDMPAPLPVIFTLTPYVSDTYHERAYYFAQNGYVFILVDVRGRGNSEGTFDPIMQEAKDGHDVVEWLARQPWSDGQVAMWGGSYAGYDQWATLKEFPPHLRTIVPAAAAFPGVDWNNKFFAPYEIQWLTVTSGVTDNANLFGEQSFWIQKFRERYLSHAPMADLDRIVGNPSAIYQTWRVHAPDDAFWAAMAPADEEFARMNIPILTITGHYDGDQPGAMEYYRRHLRLAPPEARDRHYLIMGPWDHAGTRKPNKEFGGLKFGDASIVDLNKLHKEWYDWAMKNGSRPEFLKGKIAYYVAGAEEWRYAESLNEIGSNRRRFYLSSDAGRANEVS